MKSRILLVLSVVLFSSVITQADTLMWTDNFNTGSALNSRWTAQYDVAGTTGSAKPDTATSIRVNPGLFLDAGQIYFDNDRSKASNIYAGINGNLVSSVVGSVYTWEGSASNWQPSVGIYWDINNWVSIGNDAASSSANSASNFRVQYAVDGVYARVDYTLDNYDPLLNQYYTFKIAFEDSQVKFYYDEGHSIYDATTLISEATLTRDDSWYGESASIIYGKGTGTADMSAPGATTNNPYLLNSHTSSTVGPNGYMKGSDISYYEIPEPATVLLLIAGGAFLGRTKK